MKPYAHQQEIIEADPKKTGIFHGTGGGKTFTALSLAQGRTLVVCPKTIKENGTWETQLEKMGKPLNLTVVSKETFRRDAGILARSRWDTLIVDEAETCLGVTPNTRQRRKQIIPKTSQLYEALEAFVKGVKPERLYLCTATITRSPMTTWGAAELLGKHYDFYEYRNMFYTRLPMPGREVWAPKSDSITKDRLATIVRSLGYTGRLSDWFDVPEQTFRDIYVEPTTAQKDRIKKLRLEFPDPIVRIGKQHQIENGSLKSDGYSSLEIIPDNKIDKILDLALEFPQMVIFAKYTEQINQIGAALYKTGRNVYYLTGQTKFRDETLEAANADPEGILIAQAQISAGWELPEYPCMVFASRTYSIADYEQGLGRIQRVNNIKKNLYINLITRGGVDEAVHKSLENKKDFSERVYANI